MSKNEKEIVVQSSLTVKESEDFKNIQHKAKAGLTNAEAIERNTIGKLKNEEDEDNPEKQD